MKYADFVEFLNKFEERFGTKPKSIGLPTTEFGELEKDLELLAPVPYSADYGKEPVIFLMGVEVKNTGGKDHANIQFCST